jgi:hypothetical protein
MSLLLRRSTHHAGSSSTSNGGHAILFAQPALHHTSLHDTMPNGDISGKALERHGIYYNQTASEESHFFSDHVDAVRRALLSFEESIPDEWEDSLLGECDGFGDVSVGPAWTHRQPNAAFIHIQNYGRRLERTAEYKSAIETFEGLQKIAKGVQQLVNEPGPEWISFWTKHVFHQFDGTSEQHNVLR